MALGQAKLEEINEEICPQSSKSVSTTTTPSSGFSFEANSLSPQGRFPGSSFEVQCPIILQKHQNMVLHYNNCFICLQEAFEEVNLLRQENLKLRAEYLDLSLLVAAKEKETMSSFSGRDIVSEFRRIGLNAIGEGGKEVSEEQRQPLVYQKADRREGREEDSDRLNTVTRGAVPKIISIRSSGFLELSNQSVGESSGCKAAPRDETTRPHRLLLAATPAEDGQEAEVVELEVFNQGMLKTELCNKWEESRHCPYGKRCQFAHGIEELRPVIRHPRYKTEICRMISSGGTCPYGHRCHFRHSLHLDEEKEVVL